MSGVGSACNSGRVIAEARRVLTAVAVIGLAAACGGSAEPAESNSTTAAAPTTAPATRAQASECRPFEPFFYAGAGGPEVQDVAMSVPLPAGESVVTGRVSTDSDYPGLFAVAIDLCGAGVQTVDELRPIATAYAKAFKAAPFADKVFALYVANYQRFTTTETAGEVKLKDPDFRVHLWNGQPSPEAELERWEIVRS